MSDIHERVCVNCGDTEETARLEACSVCRRWYCPDCAHRAGFGRKFCSAECARAYYFSGEVDEDADELSDDD